MDRSVEADRSKELQRDRATEQWRQKWIKRGREKIWGKGVATPPHLFGEQEVLLLLLIIIIILILLTRKLLVWFVKGLFRRKFHINPMIGRAGEGRIVGSS